MNIEGYSPNPYQTMRIMSALWTRLHPDDGLRPMDWHPSRSEVRAINMKLLVGVGRLGSVILQQWLAEGD
jgi:hypothetical protein